MALPKVGVEAVIEGMAAFEADSKRVNKAFDDMDTGASKLGRGATGLTSHLTSLGASLLKLGAVAGGAALVGVTALAGGLATFAVGGIKQAIDLDQQVANIAATMGATQDTAETLKDELKGLALDLSLNPDLTVDVTQAGEAIEVLAANGALATDEFGKLTQASKDLAVQTVALANATGSDFTTAATIATDAMALFGLKTDEMGKAVDGAAGIMNASKFNAQDYQLALSNAGGIAAEMGISLEDFNTVLAGTASNFASGSDAGTSFKALMQRLANPTDEVKAAMQQYGISLFDANGEMRSMSDIAQDLNQVFNGTVTITSQVGGATKEQAKAAATASKNIDDLTRNVALQEDKYKLALDIYNEHLKYYDASEPAMRKEALALEGMANKITDNKEKLAGYQAALDTVAGSQARTVTSTTELTEAQKAQLAATLGGADGARILLGIADLTAEEFNTLSESVNRSGQGLEAAALRVNTVKGAMDIFKGVLQAIQIQVGDAFLPLLKELAVNLTGLATQNGPMIVAFFEQVADAIGQTIVKGKELFTAFQEGGTGGLLVALGMTPETLTLIQTTIDGITAKIATLQTIFAQFGAMGAGVSLLSMLGMDSESIGMITVGIETVMTSLTSLANWWTTTWPIIQAAALTGWEIIKGIFISLQMTLGPVFTQLQTQFAQIGESLNQLGIDWSDVWNAIVTATGIVAAAIGAIILGIIGVVAGLATGIASGISAAITAFQSFSTAIAGIIDGIALYLKGFVATISAILQGDWAAAWQGWLTMVEGMTAIVKGNFDAMVAIVTGAANIMMATIGGFVKGVIGFFQGLYHQLVGGSIVPEMINAIVGWFKRLPQMIMAGLSSLVAMIITPFEDALSAVEEIWKPDKWFQIGSSVIEGIVEGIKKTQDKVLELLKELAKDAIKAAMSSIGASSPAKEFMIVGDSMIEGMLLGAEKAKFAKRFVDDLNMGGIARQLGTGGGQWRNFRNIIKNEIGASFDQLMTSGMSAAQVIDKIQKVAAKLNFPPSFASEFAMANGLIEHLTSSVTEFQKAMRLESMGRMVQMGGQFASIGSGFADILKDQLEGTQNEIAEFKEFLAGDDDTFVRRIQADIGSGQMGELQIVHNRITAQLELNQLLKEQARQQKLITEQQKSQERLSFLQQQIELIKMGRELGGNVFKGLKFGLDASVEDLLAATNNVVTAMVGQINEDLEISSPSKVMARIGQQMMAGLQGGIASMTPVLNAQLSASVAGPLSPSMAGAMNSSSYSTTNNFNVGGNNINNGMQAAEFEARVLQVIRRNL